MKWGQQFRTRSFQYHPISKYQNFTSYWGKAVNRRVTNLNNIEELTINWQRAILIDSPIDNELVKKLTPQILDLRQKSTDPITIGIDSPGGSLAALDIILALLTGPDQNGNKGEIITVATHRAYSAAANFLAFGTYSVALSHAQVLYHDVRYGGMEDVTPEKARDAAKQLQDTNDRFALRLAHLIIKRLVWIYIDLSTNFVSDRTEFPKIHERYASLVSTYAPKVDDFESLDLASFATSLWARLSRQNDTLISNVMTRLEKWVYLTKFAKCTETYRVKGSRTPGLLDGVNELHKKFSGKADNFQSYEEDLKLLLCLIVDELSDNQTDSDRFPSVIDHAVREFGILDSMNDSKHINYASNLMLKHSHVFFDSELDNELDSMPKADKEALFSKAAPHARLLWHFCVLLCRELFEGEHILNPSDAQLLGLVDEVAGGGPIQSRRDFRIEAAKKVAAKKEAAKKGAAKKGAAKKVTSKPKSVAK
jgi:ATP-dependent protease ClpP protease subunit